jgi:hypothetical protein
MAEYHSLYTSTAMRASSIAFLSRCDQQRTCGTIPHR